MYITDGEHVRIIAKDGTVSTLTITEGPRLSSTPAGIAVDPGGVVYVADEGNRCVVRVSPDGKAVVLQVAEGYEMQRPTGVTIGPKRSIYVLEEPRIWKTSSDGKLRVHATVRGVN